MQRKEALAFVYRLRNRMLPGESKQRIYLSETGSQGNFVYLRWKRHLYGDRYVEHIDENGLVDCSVFLKGGRIYHVYELASTSKESLAELVLICIRPELQGDRKTAA